MKASRVVVALAILSGVSACGGNDVVNATCDEPQRYQAVVPEKKVEAPEGLDPLNEFAEMPIPKAQGAPARPPGSRCIELPPAIGTSD